MEQLSIQNEDSLKRTYPVIGKRGVEIINTEKIMLDIFILAQIYPPFHIQKTPLLGGVDATSAIPSSSSA